MERVRTTLRTLHILSGGDETRKQSKDAVDQETP